MKNTIKESLKKLTHRQQIKFALYCALSVKHLMKDERSINALIKLEMFIEDKITIEEMQAAAADAARAADAACAAHASACAAFAAADAARAADAAAFASACAAHASACAADAADAARAADATAFVAACAVDAKKTIIANQIEYLSKLLGGKE